MDTNQIFDDAYWAHQPPEVRKLRAIEIEADRVALAQALILRGFIIDTQPMVWLWDPYKVMLMRSGQGLTWVPSLAQANLPVIPTGFTAGVPAYDPLHPPLGSIRTSLNLADFPPFDPPAAPTPPPALSSYVGHDMGSGVFASVPDDPTGDGIKVTEPRGTFICHETPWGKVYFKIG